MTHAIKHGLAGIDVPAVEAIFAGHSHYDHIGDLPVILGMAGRARRSSSIAPGVHALAPYAAGRGTALEDAQDWVWLEGKGGERRPIRFRAVLSDHAPQVDHYLWRGGELKEDWKEPWSAHRFHDLKAGQPFALVIDLMSSDLKTVRYRIYYQDSANSWGIGEPPLFDGRPYDLAVLCIASYDKAAGQPGSILTRLRPRHVLVTHYDDFFRPQDRPVRFAGLLTEAKVDRYLRKICEVLDCGGAGCRAGQPRLRSVRTPLDDAAAGRVDAVSGERGAGSWSGLVKSSVRLAQPLRVRPQQAGLEGTGVQEGEALDHAGGEDGDLPAPLEAGGDLLHGLVAGRPAQAVEAARLRGSV